MSNTQVSDWLLLLQIYCFPDPFMHERLLLSSCLQPVNMRHRLVRRPNYRAPAQQTNLHKPAESHMTFCALCAAPADFRDFVFNCTLYLSAMSAKHILYIWKPHAEDLWGLHEFNSIELKLKEEQNCRHRQMCVCVCVSLPFSDCHQEFLRWGLKVVMTFSIRWLMVLYTGSYGRRESQSKHFFSSWSRSRKS